MKNFLYLMQGESRLVKDYFFLNDRESADAIFLTYDKEIENAIYFPDSTWSEGRNKLLDLAKQKGQYLYYIFCDDDIEFKHGSWDEFERQLLIHKPAIGCPVFPKTRRTRVRFMNTQIFLVNDEQLMAFHMDVLKDSLVLPYIEELDRVMFWCSSYIQETLIQNFYGSKSLQFNNIEILNREHGRYDLSNRKIFKEVSDDWLKKEFKSGFIHIVNPNEHRIKLRFKLLLLTALYFINRKLFGNDNRANKKKLSRILNHDSKLLKHYNYINSQEKKY